MTHVVDINRARIKKAMIQLAIEPEELIAKTLDDFDHKNVSSDIKHIRYQFFLRRQQELIKKIRTCVKEDIIRSIAKSQVATKNSEKSEILEYSKNSSQKLGKIKKKLKETANKYFEDVKGSIKDVKALEEKLNQGQKLRESVKTSISQKRVKMNEFKQIQEKNYAKQNKLLQQEVNNSSKYTENSPVKVLNTKNLSLSPKSLIKTSSKKIFSLSPKSFSKKNSESELEIANKIKKYQEKMDKSQEIYDTCIKNKKDAMKKLIEKSIKVFKASTTEKAAEKNKKLYKIIEKSQSFEKRKNDLFKLKNKNLMNKRRTEIEKILRAKSKFQETQRLNNLKNTLLEKKMSISSATLEKKQEKWARDLEIRNELQRLKEEEILLNAERKKKIL